MDAAEKADQDLQAARMRELFGDFQQETTELIVDMEDEPVEPIKQIKIEEDVKTKESTEKSAGKESDDKGVKEAYSEPELTIEEKGDDAGQRRRHMKMTSKWLKVSLTPTLSFAFIYSLVMNL